MLKVIISKTSGESMKSQMTNRLKALGFTQFTGAFSTDIDFLYDNEIIILHPTKEDLLTKRFESHKYPWQVRKEILFRKFNER